MKIVNQFDGLNPVNSLILMASFVGTDVFVCINENFMYNVCQKFFNEINKQEVVRNRYKRERVFSLFIWEPLKLQILVLYTLINRALS